MKLIIINGPPGSGKSTVAEALHKTLPSLSFLIKFDAQRRFLTNRHEDTTASNDMTYKVCRAIMETCFKEGKDVIFDRVVSDAAVLDEFTEIASRYSASVFEFILWADEETILHRNKIRPAPSDGLADSRPVTNERAKEFWKAIDEFKTTRPQATIIDVQEYNFEKTLEKIQSIIQN